MITSVTVKITQELDRRVRVLAAEHDQNRSEFIRQAIWEQVAELTEPITNSPHSEGPEPVAASSAAAKFPATGETA
jgi:hypothetical protein